MKLTSLGIFLVLLGALALCPLLKSSLIEGNVGSRRARGVGGQGARGHGAHGQGAQGHRGRRHRAGYSNRDMDGDHPSWSYDQVRRDNMAPVPATSDSAPQVEVTANSYQESGYGQEAPGAGSASGIPGSEITPGDEDLYILKSEVVPPVCPACPTRTACPRNEPCPPCPPCARCPEPAFECKKVPNYKTNNSQYLPRPVLTDFSQFGM